MSRKNKPNRKTGEKYIDADGYVRVKYPKHPHCNQRGYVFQHRLVMEKKIGRYLRRRERVHHINEVRHDNRPNNLHLCKNNREHSLIHRPPRYCKCGRRHFARGYCVAHYREWYYASVDAVAATCQKCGAKYRRSYYVPKDGLQLCRNCRWPKRHCSECGKPAIAKGLCHAHYQRKFLIPCADCGKPIRKGGRNIFPPKCWRCRFPKRVCEICGKPNDAADLCMNHYARFRRARKKFPQWPRHALIVMIR